MNVRLLKAILAALVGATAAGHVQAAEPEKSNLAILSEYAEDYKSDPTFNVATTFGVDIGGDFYTIMANPASDGNEASVIVRKGAPDLPVFYFTLKDADYLGKLYRQEFNPLTLMAKAFSSDVTPMDIEVQEGFQPPEDFGEMILQLTFHFWTRGNPELIPFGPEMTQVTHGSNAGIFYYQPGFRSGWFDIRPGDHVNEDERSRDNPFPSMFIMIHGEVTALVGDEEIVFKEGNAMFVPAGISHQFINEGEAPAFGFLFMFGDGA